MNKNTMVLEYYEKNSLDSKSLRDRILSLFDLFSYLSNSGLEKKDIDEDLMRYIIKQISPHIQDEFESLVLESYLACYVIRVLRRVMGSSLIPVKEDSEIEVYENNETIDVNPDDIPDKKYDLEFLKLIGVEDPE